MIYEEPNYPCGMGIPGYLYTGQPRASGTPFFITDDFGTAIPLRGHSEWQVGVWCAETMFEDRWIKLYQH